ncbi:MAG: vWA domain-containing protein [Gammaproteobacteria bacterium]
MFGFAHHSGLLLLPLALLPFLLHGQKSVSYSSLALLPPDRLSDLATLLLRLFASLCITALVFGISGLFQSEKTIERIGQGAQTVLLLDSSGSMDKPFYDKKKNKTAAESVAKFGTYESKGQTARRVLADYASQRQQDMFSLFVFSSNPIAVLPLTEKQDLVQAAIAAGSIEKGLASTDLAAGLIRSLDFFEDKPFAGSRILMLVSDGAARLSMVAQEKIKYLMEKHRVTLYWFYLRGYNGPNLFEEVDKEANEKSTPEQIVHKFFSEMKSPYRAYSIENPDALNDAVTEVGKLQNLPIHYQDIIPKRDLSNWCYGLAFTLLLLLTAAKLFEIQRWR